MTSHHDSTGIAALDELGHRIQDATARSRRRRRQRRWPAVVLGALALAATPAIAAVLDSPPDSIEDQLPRVAAAVDYDDPAATGRALTREGFRVHWVLITDAGADDDSPTRSRHVAAPPSGTKILSVLNQNGGNEVSAVTRDLQIEIAPAGSKILQSHR